MEIGYRVLPGHAGKNDLSASAPAHHRVGHQISHPDAQVRVHHGAGGHEGRALLGVSDINQLFRIPELGVHHRVCLVNLLPHPLPHLVLRHIAVAAQGDDDLDLFPPGPAADQLIQQNRQNGAYGRGAGAVVHDHGDPLIRGHDVLQLWTADGVLDGVQNHPLRVPGGLGLRRVDHADKTLVRHLHAHHLISVWETDFHGLTPLFSITAAPICSIRSRY